MSIEDAADRPGLLQAGLIVAAIAAAISLGWNGISRQLHAEAYRQHEQTLKKASYRRTGAILHCAPSGSMFSDTPPVPTTTVVPDPEARAPGFDLGRIDRLVDTQDCRIDDHPQALWAATHPQPPAP